MNSKLKERYHKEILPNGIRVVTEEIPYVRSVSIGLWLEVGSKNEPQLINGASHFIEHMLFKGTSTRTAIQIAEETDRIGGQLNALTGREYTCFYAKVLDENMPRVIDLLSDMFFNSLFDEEEIKKEKDVILEEIKMYEDTPDELVHDLFVQNIWNKHPLGRPVIGTSEIVAQFSRAEILDFFRQRYTPERIVLAVAGNIISEQLIDELGKIFVKADGPGWEKPSPPPEIQSGIQVYHRDLEQVHFCLGTDGLSYSHEDRFAFYLLNTITGKSMSSRLFQEIREKRGLAYSIYSYHLACHEAGLFAVYAGVSREHYSETVKITLSELSKLKEEEVGESELSKAKQQLKSNLVLSLEDTASRMSRLAKTEIYFNRFFTLDEILSQIEAVSAEDVKKVAGNLFRNEFLTVTTIGPLSEAEAQQVELVC
ncbi:MAG: pitrilysin family protein [bacterium]|nr:pitrilysin family protein [bacterium]